MSAFSASMKLKPQLQPEDEDRVPYKSLSGGVSIEARFDYVPHLLLIKSLKISPRGLSYTYPGSTEPALRDVNLKLAPGESLAIVGFNGSGVYPGYWQQPNPAYIFLIF